MSSVNTKKIIGYEIKPPKKKAFVIETPLDQIKLHCLLVASGKRNELEVDVLCADDSGEVVLKHIQSQYMEYLEKKLPQKIEQCFFDRDLARKKGESMLQYCTRRNTFGRQLAAKSCTTICTC